jgi:amino acid transporter
MPVGRRSDDNWILIVILIVLAITCLPILGGKWVADSYERAKMSQEDRNWWFATVIGLLSMLALVAVVIIYCVTR